MQKFEFSGEWACMAECPCLL